MNKFDKIKTYFFETLKCGESKKITFCEFEEIAGAKPDHSFLRYKKELNECGIDVKISLKENTMTFCKNKD